MQSCGEVPCGSSQSYLMGAGGVRGVCHTECGLCALTRARALRGVICAPTARKRRQSRPERSRQAEGKNPFSLDSKEPQWDIQDYLKGEGRFASVTKQFPKEADELFAAAQENAQWRYKSYLRMLGTAW